MSVYRKRGESRAMALLCGISAYAISTAAISQEKADEKLDEVIVTGSRIARPNLESPVPVTTVSGEELFETGSTSVGDLLNDLPALRSTFSQSNSSRFLGTTGLNLLDLRGLGTQRTLVLVNGRRHVGSDILSNGVSPDINTFPTDLIERIDVVTGGSSAVYGSDAIAGVVNFVLKKNFEGLEFRGQAGDSQERDSSNYYGSILGGMNFADDKGNIAFNLEYAEQEPFFASDRREFIRQGGFVVTDTDPPGLANGSDGTPDRLYFNDIRSTAIANGGNILIAPANTTTGPAPCGRDKDGLAFSCSLLWNLDGTLTPQTGERIGLAPNGSFVGGNGTNNRERNALAIYPRLTRYSLNVFGNLELSEALQPFIEAKYVRTDSLRYGTPGFFQGTTMGGDVRERPRWDNPYLTDQARGLINSTRTSVGLAPITAAATRLSVRRNLLDLGPRQEDAQRETTRIVLGLQGEVFGGWNYEVSANYGKFKEDTLVFGNINVQRFLLAMDAVSNGTSVVCRSQIDAAARIPYDPDTPLSVNTLAADVAACVPMNPFGDGSITDAVRNYVAQDTHSIGEIEQTVFSASITGDTGEWFSLPGGPIGIAAGIESRQEKNYFATDELVSSGITFYNAIPELVAPTLKVNEVFTELRLPLVTDKTGFKELTVNLAGRFADYDGETGGVFAYNAGLDWAPLDSVRLRAGIATSVRAPNLVDLYSAQGQNFALINDPCTAQNVGAGSATRAANCAASGVPNTWSYTYPSSLSFISGGNPDLKEETSDSLTVGLVLTPSFMPGFTVSADYFDIEIDDVITAPSAQQILNACYDGPDTSNQFCGLFQRFGAAGGPNAGDDPYRVINGTLLQTVLNYAKYTARGIDVEMAYSHEAGALGNLNARAVWTHSLERNDYLDPVNPGYADVNLLELGDPKDAFNVNLDLTRGKTKFGYQFRYIGKQVLLNYEDFFGSNGSPAQNIDYADRKYYPTVTYHDLRVAHDFGDAINGYIGVDNVTDKLAPLGLTGATEGGGMYEVRGRYFYTGFRYKF